MLSGIRNDVARFIIFFERQAYFKCVILFWRRLKRKVRREPLRKNVN